MNQHCQFIVFSNKAYNAIIDETIKKDPIETGGILLGHVLDNGTWIVMEVLPPGIHSTHEYAYFEYDEGFVNYLANSVASKYEQELSLLGLWHRHPGSMDYFSPTDNKTNAKFASINPYGAISGLVNVDPRFRLTMRHVSIPLQYEIVNFEVGDDLIPEAFFELKHFPKVGLHPDFTQQQSEDEKKNSETSIVPASEPASNTEQAKTGVDNNKKDRNTLRGKLRYWAEKSLMVIGAITLLILLVDLIKLFSYELSAPQCKQSAPGYIEQSDTTKRDTLKTDTVKKGETENAETKKTQENPNNKPASRIGGK